MPALGIAPPATSAWRCDQRLRLEGRQQIIGRARSRLGRAQRNQRGALLGFAKKRLYPSLPTAKPKPWAECRPPIRRNAAFGLIDALRSNSALSLSRAKLASTKAPTTNSVVPSPALHFQQTVGLFRAGGAGGVGPWVFVIFLPAVDNRIDPAPGRLHFVAAHK